jgi:hypothetical protein
LVIQHETLFPKCIKQLNKLSDPSLLQNKSAVNFNSFGIWNAPSSFVDRLQYLLGALHCSAILSVGNTKQQAEPAESTGVAVHSDDDDEHRRGHAGSDGTFGKRELEVEIILLSAPRESHENTMHLRNQIGTPWLALETVTSEGKGPSCLQSLTLSSEHDGADKTLIIILTIRNTHSSTPLIYPLKSNTSPMDNKLSYSATHPHPDHINIPPRAIPDKALEGGTNPSPDVDMPPAADDDASHLTPSGDRPAPARGILKNPIRGSEGSRAEQ